MLSLNLPQTPEVPPMANVDLLSNDPEVRECRARIDRADEMILDALEYRARCVAHMALVKQRLGAPVMDSCREDAVMDHVTGGEHTLPRERRRAIFATIVAQMRDWQSTLR